MIQGATAEECAPRRARPLYEAVKLDGERSLRVHVSISRDRSGTRVGARAAGVRWFLGRTWFRRRVAIPAILSTTALIVTGVTAVAGNQITATITVVPPVKSVTVSVSALTYGFCNGGSSTTSKLGFPNGQCFTTNYTVTNGNTAAQIDATGSDAVPSSGGTHWTLCGGSAPACTAPSSSPAQDQYKETVFNGSAGSSMFLTNSPQCDGAFSNPTCGASPASTSDSEALQIIGPSTSSDGSPTFTATVTYTAV